MHLPLGLSASLLMRFISQKEVHLSDPLQAKGGEMGGGVTWRSAKDRVLMMPGGGEGGGSGRASSTFMGSWKKGRRVMSLLLGGMWLHATWPNWSV